MENYNYKEFYEEQVFEPLSVANGAARSGNPFETVVTGITIEEGDRSVGLLVKETEKVVKEVSLLSKLTAPVQKGDAVGTVRYYLESEGEERILLREYSVIAVEEVAARDFTYCFRYIVEEFLP